MDARLDTLTIELYQVNTRVGCIARRQAVMGGFTASPSPSSQALKDEGDDGGFSDNDVDKDEDASFSNDEEMTAFQWLALCHL